MIAQRRLRVGVLSPPPVLDDGSTLGCTAEDLVRAGRTQTARLFRRFGGAGVHICAALSHPQPETPAGPGPRASVIALFPVSNCRSGNVLLKELAARGVCVDHVTRCSGRMRRNLVLEFRDRELVVEDSASRAAPETDYDLRPIADLEWLLVSGALHPAVLRSAAAAAAEHRVLWSWNPSCSQGDRGNLLKELAPGAELLQLAAHEAARCAGVRIGTEPGVVATALQELTAARSVIVTCGTAGAVGRDPRGRLARCPTPHWGASSAAATEARFFALVNRALWTAEKSLADALRWAAVNLS